MRQQGTHRKANPTGDLQQVGRELSEWRRAHHAPTLIPENLWARAAALATQHGASAVARAFCLNHTQLKRRMGTEPAEGSALTFVDLLPLPMPINIGECAMEVESHRGSRMRVVMKDVPPLCLAGLLREFVGKQRCRASRSIGVHGVAFSERLDCHVPAKPRHLASD